MTPFALMLVPQDADAVLIIKFCKEVAVGSLEWLCYAVAVPLSCAPSGPVRS